MITICKKCGKKYQFDSAKTKVMAFKFICKSCGHENTVRIAHEKSLGPEPTVSKPGGIDPSQENRPVKSVSFEISEGSKKNAYSSKRRHRLRFGLTAKVFVLMVLIGMTPLIACWAFALAQGQARIDLMTATIVFICAAAWLSGRTLSKPIIKLTEAVYRISIGELDKEILIKRNDEIGNLSESIVRMQDSLRISMEKLQRKS